MKRLLTLTAALAAFSILTGTAHAGDTYADAVGDSTSAPDIRQVTLTDGGNGTVAVAIDLDADVAVGSSVVLGINSDRDSATGAHCGCDYMVWVDDRGIAIGKCRVPAPVAQPADERRPHHLHADARRPRRHEGLRLLGGVLSRRRRGLRAGG
jgi:hypothetical protein